ncbi:MAG TPA: nucleotidyltransferase domain-containing protein [Candidatus Kapabacteria bacterium]|nr:nucleotidyltransferase domain-containing protein [Candidatus Kapabacteria bacterium]HPO63226.1 nucleotidyltransferase domain-containing protein [Candidatus Kapabacteria bacterium]
MKNNKDLFYKKLNITKIGIFGSFSRNEQSENSDIDIIIEMPVGTEKIFEKKRELKKILKNQFNRDIDICRERSIKPLFREIILKEAIYV